MSRSISMAMILAMVAATLLLAAGCAAPTPPTATPVPATPKPPAPTAAPAPASYTDAFAYCAAVANIDAPDARYTGAKVPDNVVDGLMTAMKMAAGADRAAFAARAQWRCMGGKVYGCNVGRQYPLRRKGQRRQDARRPR